MSKDKKIERVVLRTEFKFLSCLVISSTLVLTGCTSDVVPVDARLSISPEQHSLSITESVDESGRCVFTDRHYMDVPILLTLRTANNSPISDALISVYADFSGNAYSGRSVLGLYDDLNGNGIVDEQTELISGPGADIAMVATSSDTGSKQLVLRVNLSCAFSAEVRAFTGAVSTRATIDVFSRASLVLQPDEFL